MLCALLAPIALWLGDGAVERALLIGSLLLIVIVELLNSSIEAAIDRIRGGYRPHRRGTPRIVRPRQGYRFGGGVISPPQCRRDLAAVIVDVIFM